MGATPTHKIEMDLNGNTASLVDVTAWVDMAAGVHHTRGRSDWTAAEPSPGTLSLTLDNTDGRFTPGRKTVYSMGAREDCLVRWTATPSGLTARVLDFYMGAPELVFPHGAAGSSQVVITSTDALAKLAKRALEAAIVETIKAKHPICYYPFTDAAPAADEDPLVIDQSGWGQPPLTPYPAIPDAVYQTDWATATGPPNDGAASLAMRSKLAYALTNDPGTSTSLRIEPYASVVDTGTDWKETTYNADRVMAVSFWLSYDDIYGPTSGVAGTTDGPFISLMRFMNIPGATAQPIDVMIRIEDRRLVLRHASSAVVQLVSTDTYSISPTDLHQITLCFRFGSAAPWPITVQAVVDGTTLASTTYNHFGSWVPADLPLVDTRVLGGALRVNGDEVYALTGSISHLSVHGPPDVYVTSAASTSPSRMQIGSSMFGWTCFYTGTNRLNYADANALWQIITAWLDRDDVAFAITGTAQAMPLGPLDSKGKSLLAAICQTLAHEDAELETYTSAGISYVRARFGTEHRREGVAAIIDVDTDCLGVPALAFDTSGVATRVTAATVSTLETKALYVDKAAIDSREWADTATSVEAMLKNQTDLMALAQYRASRGRPETVTPSSITVDMKTAKATYSGGNATLSFLLGLVSGETLRLKGFSADLAGYTATRCVAHEVQESYDLQGARFTVALTPWEGEGYLDAQSTVLVMDADSVGTVNTCSLEDGLAPFDTTVTIKVPNTTQLTTDSADYPTYIGFPGGTELMYMATAPSAPVASTTNPGTHVKQSFTGVIRGVAPAGGVGAPTSARTHVAGEAVEYYNAYGDMLLEPYIGF